MNPNIPYLLAIHRNLNLTFPRFKVLKKAFHNDWKRIYNASFKDIEPLSLDIQAKKKWHRVKDTTPNEEMNKLLKSKADVCIYGESNYPNQLLTIHSPPVILFYKGESLNHPTNLAMVGSRKISFYSKNIIEKIIPDIIHHNIQIVSGLALGVDKESHIQAIKNGGKTLAVLGSGIDVISPSTHTKLSEEILRTGGTIISEFPLGTSARPENFPIRNRIVSGLSKGVLVIQAAEKSGSIITARLGLEQGKEIMTFPGSIFESGSKGCHTLIQKGEAALVKNSKDILETLNVKNLNIQIKSPSLTQEETNILTLFQEKSSWSLEELLKATKKEKPKLISTLTMLEMKNQIYNPNPTEYLKT